MVSFTPRPLYPPDRRLDGPQNRSGRRGEEKILDRTGTRTLTAWLSSQSLYPLRYNVCILKTVSILKSMDGLPSTPLSNRRPSIVVPVQSSAICSHESCEMVDIVQRGYRSRPQGGGRSSVIPTNLGTPFRGLSMGLLGTEFFFFEKCGWVHIEMRPYGVLE
jgi:hypothetical protein